MGQNADIRRRGSSSSDAVQMLPHGVASYARTYPDGYVSAWHDHPRHQLVYAVAGLMMAEAGGTTWAVPAGAGLIVPAGMLHEIRMAGEVQLQSLYIDPAEPGAEMMAECRAVAISALLARLIAALCAMNNPWPLPPRAHHLSRLILIELGTAEKSPLALPYPADDRLRRVCDALMDSPGSVQTIDHWAALAGMSRRSFTRRFQQQTGLSFGGWRNRLRCQIALRAAARGERMEQVAQRLGYASRQSLQTMMRRLA
ncbi:helix-turn-helix transcriptional regulator [Leisingera aquaemixtae]|uniref:AraC family transcriptional regulator n=1 Tax=Leisingera aquaemixtae TaxID=1396826 RepID=UPI001C9692B5|nr:helix-turn-helix transcriptional regulator [Leisingera aquaemixtae]MBY6067741.1 helix-turn-helix transcriptional regulator [Leisingera aquaemixtae]